MGIPRCPNTGDPLPEKRVENADCKDRTPGATRWIATKPHVPLAISDADGIDEATGACCAPWAHLGDRYHALDAYGQIVGKAAIDGGEGYDVTRCYELSFAIESGEPGIGLFASADGSYKPPASAQWKATGDQLASLAELDKAIFSMVIDEKDWRERVEHWPDAGKLPGPITPRVLLFQVVHPKQDSESDEAPNVVRYAAVGGIALYLARLETSGRWVLVHTELEMSSTEWGPPAPYQPLAAIDMDGNGYPELLYQWNEGPAWADVVVSAPEWQQLAESIGGATL